MDSGEGQLKYLSQLRSFSVWVNATDVGGCRGLDHEDQWESEFFVSRDADSKQTLNWSLKKAQSTPCCQLTNFMTDWAADGWGVITHNRLMSKLVMIESWNIAPPPHRPGILLLLMASNCNFLVFCSVDWRQKYNYCLPCHQLNTGFYHIDEWLSEHLLGCLS